MIHKAGHAVARRLSERHFEKYAQHIRSSREEHLTEFDAAWEGMRAKIVRNLHTTEKEAYEGLRTEFQRDGFIIIRAFASAAATKGENCFPIAQESLAYRLGISRTAAADIISRLVELQVLKKSAPAIPHKTAAIYQWLFPGL